MDRIAAYQLVIQSLPSPARWSGAIRRRDDGSSAPGVFAVLDALRMEFLARIGDLADGEVGSGGLGRLLDFSINATHQDALTALELAINHLPKLGTWERALSMRQDGTTVLGVLSGLCDIRREMHECVGVMQDLRPPING